MRPCLTLVLLLLLCRAAEAYVITEYVQVGENDTSSTSIATEEWWQWPYLSYEIEHAESRRVLYDLTSSKQEQGYVVMLFHADHCPRCTDIYQLFSSMDIPVTGINYQTSSMQMGGTAPLLGRNGVLKGALNEVASNVVEPYVFLLNRYIGDAPKIRFMFQVGALHSLLEKYHLNPRLSAPVNVGPVIAISSTMDRADRDRQSLPWEASVAHPQLVDRVEIEVVEARNLTLLPGKLDTPPSSILGQMPGGLNDRRAANPYVEVKVNSAMEQTSIVPGTSSPVWNQTFVFFPLQEDSQWIQLRVWHADGRSPSQLPYFSGLPPQELGFVNFQIPAVNFTLATSFPLVSPVSMESVVGEIFVSIRKQKVYYLLLESGRTVRLAGITVRDPDVMNNSILVELNCSHGFISLPSLPRLSALAGTFFYNVDPRSVVNSLYPSFGSLQAALSELKYQAPSDLGGAGELQDSINIHVDDQGNTGAGGSKTDHLLLNISIFPGPDNQPPSLFLWPEYLSEPVLPYSGSVASRKVPLGTETAIFGLHVEDEDVYEGYLTVTVSSLLGKVSVHGFGSWLDSHPPSAAGKAGEEGDAEWISGRQITSAEERGSFTRDVLCSLPGGFADEYRVQGPYGESFFVRRNSIAGEHPDGSVSPVRSFLIHAGSAFHAHFDAEGDFELQYRVEADRPVDVLLLDHENFLKYARKQFFSYDRTATLLGQYNATIGHAVISVSSPSRWFLVVQQSIDLQKPGWRQDGGGRWVSTLPPGAGAQGAGYDSGGRPDWRQQGGGGVEYETGSVRQDVHMIYDLKFQKLKYSVTSFQEATGASVLLDPPASLLCRWILAEERDSLPVPPGYRSSGLHFLLGDGHRDTTMRFSGDERSVKKALASLTYLLEASVPSSSSQRTSNDTITVIVDDNGNTGGGGPRSSTMRINVEILEDGGSGSNSSQEERIEVQEEEEKEEDEGADFASVPVGNYSAIELAAAVSSSLASSISDFFWKCDDGPLGQQRGTADICVAWKAAPPFQFSQPGHGGSIRLLADPASMTFTFTYDPVGEDAVINGQYTNALPCDDQGGGIQAKDHSCGWWGGKFLLLFNSGPNKDRSLARVLGFGPFDYSSSVVQYTVSSPLGAAEQKSPAVLTAPFRYFVALAESAPRGMRSSWKSNRPPTINVPLKTRADFLSVAVPPGSMDGECAVRSSGVSYVANRVSGGLDVNVGVGLLLNRYYKIAPGDVALRDFTYTEKFLPNAARAQVIFTWDHAVLVSEVLLIMTSDGIVELEGFVGGNWNAEVGEYNAEEVNVGWVSIGRANGTAGAGPFVEGTRSYFRWPANNQYGSMFRIVITRTWHEQGWAIYRSFPTWNSRSRLIGNTSVIPRLLKGTAGEEISVPGLKVEDPDLGEDRVNAPSLIVRRLRVELSCLHGYLFVDAPFADSLPSTSSRQQGQALDSSIALGYMGDVSIGVSSEEPIVAGNTRTVVKPFYVPQVPGVSNLNLAAWRGRDAAILHFLEGGGTADRRMIFEGPLAAVQQALRGLRYKSPSRVPGWSPAGRVCAAGLLCGLADSSLQTLLGGYGGTGADEITILVDDLGNSDRVCQGGGADPLAVCTFQPGTARRAQALLEVTTWPRPTNSLGSQANAFTDHPACVPCYVLHPSDSDLCMHIELYWSDPDLPGNSYSRKALEAYTEGQRQVWEEEVRKPCEGFLQTSWNDDGGPVRLSTSSSGTLALGREGSRRILEEDGEKSPGGGTDNNAKKGEVEDEEELLRFKLMMDAKGSSASMRELM
ncbi:hypothetical protein GUITHDRAFT_103068 [Guillardia theta CCMP2712]|uniref:C2 domain-containing protein n=1 Tax=Guillardia theta (strain CCMP2712) TaxID=905079 RepID=L1JST8_GUITC|nr:hypothetical protein GUITHDRAFT_103068 [Guillardia theta CCMP2712]EKX51148.1 hypothetical protein GUITHDRAFT_103068 [Guillardia theta CCMP2712]|eukprot:XP_005838128.1 hypothetical protein GUITHDRAFT_103068 [Guillardia theta CCMP2712]